MKKTIRTIWNAITTTLVVIVLLFAVLLVGARVIGLQVFTVLSGSMEPTYHTGSLIYVREVEPYTVEADQVITFMLDEDTVATHRVVEVVPDETDPSVVRYRTKGDANDAVDGSLVHYKNVIGTPVFTIPKLGYVANYIQNPPGMYIAIAAGAILILLVFLPDLFESEDESEKTKKTQKKPAAQTAAPVKRANTSTVGASVSSQTNRTPTAATTAKKPATPGTTAATTAKRPATPGTTAATTAKRPVTPGTTAATTAKKPATPGTTAATTAKRPVTPGTTAATTAKRPVTPGTTAATTAKRPAPPGTTAATTAKRPAAPGTTAPTTVKRPAPKPAAPTEKPPENE